jgi:hypothetical protein
MEAAAAAAAAAAPGGHDPAPFEVAHHLLSQLFTVARQLPASLDPVTLAETMLRDVGRVAPYDNAEVLVRAGGGVRLVPLARSGTAAAEHGAVSLAEETPFNEAWTSQEPQVVRRLLWPGEQRGAASGLVLPLRLGVRGFGLLGLQTAR